MVISPRLKSLRLSQAGNWTKDLANSLHQMRASQLAFWQEMIRTVWALILAATGYAYVLLFAVVAYLLVDGIATTLSIDGEHASMSSVLIQALAAWLCTLMAVYLATKDTEVPSGRPLSDQEAPELFRLVDEVRLQFGSPVIGRIVLTPRFELALIRRPRSVYPFLFENILVIGLPLLESTSPVYLKVLLARRIGHLASRYRRPSAWLYYLRFVWEHHRVMFSQGWGPHHLIMRAFFCCYAPLYRAATRHTARREELYSDHCAMQIIDDFTVAEAISLVSAGEAFFKQRFLPTLQRQASKHPAPPYLPYSRFPQAVGTGLTRECSKKLLDQAWARKTLPGDAVPALKERLEAIGHSRTPLPGFSGNSAATSVLGDALKPIRTDMDTQWLERHRDSWAEHFNRSEQERVRLRQLLGTLSDGKLSERDALACGQLVCSHVEDRDKRTRLLKLISSKYPQDAKIGLFVGRYLLSVNDSEGVQVLEAAMRADDACRPAACQAIAQYLARRGKDKFAQVYLRRAQQ